jgi:aminocarboxymuconate-semialdehyde decarboxylase
MIIDIHAHCLPQETLDALAVEAARFPSVDLQVDGDRHRLGFAGHGPTRAVAPKLRRLPPRQAFLAEQGIDLQLTGGWLDAFGYELPAEEGADWSRFQNEHMMTLYRDVPEVMPLATVPLQSGRHAAQVLEEAVAAGMPGAMIGTQPHGSHGNLDDPDLDALWDAAARLRVPIIVHPMFGSGDARLHDYQMMNAVGRISDVSIAISRMLFAGTLPRFPELRLVASTGGGALPYMLGRLERNYLAHPGDVSDPREGFAMLYFDSIVFQTDVLRFLADKVGVERIMLGSDYPFPIGDPQPRRVVETAGFDDAGVSAMLGGTAKALFGI